ncbi:hypothetical protein BDR26DRAFT_566476 [Obelidium mucronatum]|nr:hypothetical protein BDR26DRAFT_566476 [Obelidium mucronatum]
MHNPTVCKFASLVFLWLSTCCGWVGTVSMDIQAGLLRADILSLLSVFLSAGNQELFLKEKTCVLVAQTAERMWPLQWPELDGFLRASFLLNLDAQECVLLIYKTIIEDTFCYENSIAEMRKKDLSTSLIAITVDSSVLNSVYTKDRESTQVESVLNIIRADPHAEGWLRRLAQNLVALKRNKDSGINSGRYEKLILLTLGYYFHSLSMDYTGRNRIYWSSAISL